MFVHMDKPAKFQALTSRNTSMFRNRMHRPEKKIHVIDVDN